jgi:hypothetical protein
VLSILFGAGSAIVLARIGVYGVPVLILSFPLVFRRVDRVAPEWLLAAFSATWFVLIAVAAPFLGSTGDTWPVAVTGLILAGGSVLASRLQKKRRATQP